MQLAASSQTEEFSPFIVTSSPYRDLWPFFVGCVCLPFCNFPFINGPEVSKYLILYIVASLGLFSISRNKEVFVPRLSSSQVSLLLALSGVLVFNYIYHRVNFFETESIERILFWSLFLYYSYSIREFQKSEKVFLYLALFLGTGLFISAGFLNFIFNDRFLSFTFQNINKAAEYVGLSLALQLGFFSQTKGKSKKLLFGLISASLAYVYFTNCRSVFLGIAGVIGYLLMARVMKPRDFLKLLLGSSFFILMFQTIFRMLGAFPTDMTHKWGSTVERWHLLQNTFSLIQDFPWGVGLGKYGQAATPYMKSLPNGAFTEGYYLFSPFSEPIRFVAEEGILTSLLIFLFFSSFMFPFHKFKTLSEKCPEAIAFFILFLVQCLFQYPLYQPISLFMVPFVLAYTAHFTIGQRSLRIPLSSWMKRGGGICFACIVVAMGVSSYISLYQVNNLALTKKVYSFWKDPSLLRNILFMSHLNENYTDMHEYALKELKRNPQNLIAFKYLGLSYVYKGDISKGCSYLKFYQAAYFPPSTVDGKIKEFCP